MFSYQLYSSRNFPPMSRTFEMVSKAGYTAVEGYGALYADDAAVAQYLLTEGRVAAVPGAAYGLSPFFRISTATSDAVLAEAISRIAAAVAALHPGETI